MSDSASNPATPLSARAVVILEISLLGGVVAGWMGVIESLLLWRIFWQPASALGEAALEYALLGVLIGTCVGVLSALPQASNRLSPRNPFCIVAIVTCVLLFQLSGNVVMSWLPGSWARVAGKALLVGSVPAALIVIGAWFRWVRGPSDRQISLSRRGVAVAGAGLAVTAMLFPMIVNRSPVYESAAAGLPNVLLIVLDTTRADRLSAYGYERPTTPTLEKLAAEGVLFSRAYSAAPWTLPSHVSIFTGVHPSRHGANLEHPHFDDRLPTLAQRMTERGFETIAITRKPWLRDEVGAMRGFQHSYDLLQIREMTGIHYLYTTLVDRIFMVQDHGARRITARFEKWLSRRGSSPFFCFLNYDEAHAEYRPPSPFREDFLGDRRDTEWGRSKRIDTILFNAGFEKYTPEDIAVFSDLYDGSIAYQDWRLAETFEILRERDLLDRTLVIVTSDHGENFGERNLLSHQFAVNNSLLHVPLIVRFPGTIPAGVKVNAPVENRLIGSLIDLVLSVGSDQKEIPLEELAATLSSGGEPDALILSELFENPFQDEFWRTSPRIDEFRRRMKSLQRHDVKYVWISDGQEELYDLVNDPRELENLADQYPAELTAFRKIVKAIETSDSNQPAPELSDELKEQLRAMGYMQ